MTLPAISLLLVCVTSIVLALQVRVLRHRLDRYYELVARHEERLTCLEDRVKDEERRRTKGNR